MVMEDREMRQLTDEQIRAAAELDAKRAAEKARMAELTADQETAERALRQAEVVVSKTENVRFTDEALARREEAKAILRTARKTYETAVQRYKDYIGA
jgi:hypothetical protein